MLKCTGHYGNAEKTRADFHAIFFLDDASQFNKTVSAVCGEISGLVKELRESGDFVGKKGESVTLANETGKFVLVGLGERDGLTLEGLRSAAADAIKKASAFVTPVVALYCPSEIVIKKFFSVSFEDAVKAMVEGALLATYRFDKYLAKKPDDKKSDLKELKIVSSDEGFQSRLKTGITRAQILVEGVTMARDLVNTPANDLSADVLSKQAAAIGKKFTLRTQILKLKDIEANKMGGLLSVNRGSSKDPRFIVLEYNDKKRRLAPYVIVGKGVTFDSGGLSIKPAASMEDMKTDMSGAATVLGAMYVVAKLKLPIRLIALIPATDNMTGGDATCPGDIIKMSNGKTVEVRNTDAEGRMILADALIYAQRFKPAGIIDLATLTGACVVALASHATGMMGNDQTMMDALKEAGEKTFERVWQLPLYEEYEEMMKGEISDLKNIGGRWGGASTAAAFLKQFVGDYPWVHLDIAGTATLEKERGYVPKGGTGVGVRLLAEYFSSL